MAKPSSDILHFLSATDTIFLFIHSFIPLAWAECDNSLPFSGVSSIPLCYIPFPSTLFHQLIFHPPSFHLAIYFLVYLSASLFPNSYIILFLEILLSSILCTCTNQSNLFNVVHLLIFLFTFSIYLYGVSIYWRPEYISIYALSVFKPIQLCCILNLSSYSNPCLSCRLYCREALVSVQWQPDETGIKGIIFKCNMSFIFVFISHFSYFFVAAAWYLLKCEGWCFPTHRRNVFSFWTPHPLKMKEVCIY